MPLIRWNLETHIFLENYLKRFQIWKQKISKENLTRTKEELSLEEIKEFVN